MEEQCIPHRRCNCYEESLPVTVCVVVGDIEDSLLTKLHLDNTLIPSLDDAALANGGNKVTTSNGGIEPGYTLAMFLVFAVHPNSTSSQGPVSTQFVCFAETAT